MSAEDSKQKRVFKPTIPQRRLRPTSSANQDSLLASLPPTAASITGSKKKRGETCSDSKPRNPSNRTSNRSHSGTNIPNASGPFSMGSSIGGGGGQAGFSVKQEHQDYTSTEHMDIEYVDMHSILGTVEHEPVLFQLKKEETCEFGTVNEPKLPIDPTGASILNINESMLHLLQLPPIMPVIDPSSLPVWVEEPNTRGELRGPDAWIDPTVDDLTVRVRKNEGLLGHFLVRRSGKVQLQINNQLFDVIMAPTASFHQQVVVIDPKMNQGFGLGEVASQYICSPNLDTLLLNRETEIAKSM